MPLKIATKTPNEGSTCKITGVLKDFDDQIVPNTSLTAATFTLHDLRSRAEINSRDGTDDILSSFDVNGNMSLTLTKDDNVIVNDYTRRKGLQYEKHVITFLITASIGGDTVYFKESVEMSVANLEFVST